MKQHAPWNEVVLLGSDLKFKRNLITHDSRYPTYSAESYPIKCISINLMAEFLWSSMLQNTVIESKRLGIMTQCEFST